MKDLFVEFRKRNVKKHLAILGSAFAFAFCVNGLLFGTAAGTKLQASAIEFAGTKDVTTGPDISLVNVSSGSDLLRLRIGHAASQVQEIEATLLTDPSTLAVKDVQNGTDHDMTITKVSNIDGVTLVMLRFKAPRDIAAGTDIASVLIDRKKAGETAVNLAATRLVSNGTSYDLTSQSVELQ